jgi:hypothetical protein
MARQKRNRPQKSFRYFFLNGKLHKVLKSSRVKDQMIAWSYQDKSRVLYSNADVIKYMQNAYTMTQVSTMIGKHKVTIEDYILEGKIKAPQKVYPIGNSESKAWSQYMFSEDDVLDLHEYILSAGREIEKLPTKNELKALMKHNVILYTKTTSGEFVPVWKAE